jgi:glycosyltransferase involved in cell wall biosynthesis
MSDAPGSATEAPTSPGARREMRTVLIFAHECAPYNRLESTIGAQRPAQFAKFLPEFGWRAIVLCCDNTKRGHGWSRHDSTAVAEAVSGSSDDTSVIIATPSLPWDGLLDRAWRWVSASNANALTALIRKPLTFAKFFTGDYSQAWQPCAHKAAEIIAASTTVHACIGEHSPDAGIFLARSFAEWHDVPWVADFRDPMLSGYTSRVRPILAPFARRLLRHAAHVVNVNPHCVAIDEALFMRPVTEIANGFDPDDFSAPAPMRSSLEFRIVYTGSVWPPGGLRIFLDGLRELRSLAGIDVWGSIRFVYRGRASALVEQTARNAGVTEILDCGPHVPHAQAVELMRSAHVLLVLSTTHTEHDDPYWANGVCPGKVFEYIAAHRPIVCVPGDDGLLDGLLREAQAGVSLSEQSRVASHLAELVGRWQHTGDVPSLDNGHLVARYSRRAGAQRMAAVLDSVTGGRLTPTGASSARVIASRVRT